MESGAAVNLSSFDYDRIDSLLAVSVVAAGKQKVMSLCSVSTCLRVDSTITNVMYADLVPASSAGSIVPAKIVSCSSQHWL